MPRYTGINHLALATGDMEATIRFWRDLLGMRLVAGLGREGYRQYFLEISERDMVAFFEWPHVEPLPDKDHGVPVKGPFGFDHVSIAVADREDLFELKARLEAAGFWASEVLDHGFILSLYSFDPNNVAIEFSWPVPGVDLRARPRMVDAHRPPCGLEGSEPQPGFWPQAEPIPEEDRRVYPGEGRELVEDD
ncbi:VOC family protein [Fundidesulfovibrio soli]|uniref:VOC family protein n=1 Tax=Fundidesulfovibrio soli TaxID=2922716 RepID=UPI001FAF1269|nr:VOC family protein [Fundidesulfovibrio soli]